METIKRIFKFKRIDKILLSGFFLAVLFAFIGFSAQCEEISEKTLRMHVLANSDTEYDQRVKIYVKDELSLFAGELIEEATSIEEAQLILSQSMDEIQRLANMKLDEINVGYSATVSLENAYFPTREYETFTLPAGEYEALQVMLGEASGQNWWCVVYPSLCISSASDEYEDFSKEEQEIIQSPDDFTVSFKVYEWYQNIKNFLSF